MPESPRWLLRHGRYEDVQKAMATLGTEASMDDVRRAAEVVKQVEGDPERRRRAWTPGVRRALIVVSVFFIFQQITGINVPLYYGPHDRPGLLHRLVRRRRRRHRVDAAGRSVSHRGPRPGRGVLRDDRLAGQLPADRGVPGLAEQDQPGRRHGLLRRPVRAGHRVRVAVPARDQGPARRGDRPDLPAAPHRARGRSGPTGRAGHADRDRPGLTGPTGFAGFTGAGPRRGSGCWSSAYPTG
jgi:Sugar (and other) transporter